MILERLGGPQRFARQWPRQPYHCAGVAGPLRDTLRTPDVDRLLNEQALHLPAFRMVRADRVLPPETITRSARATSQGVRGLLDPAKVRAELGHGTTLILQGADRHWRPLADVCRHLSAEVGHAVFVNAYLTPPQAQGFAAHQDPYHAWLVQTEGAKRWQVWAPRKDPRTGPPDLDVTLREGDVLWIPRGWWHSGRSTDSTSLHLTFTVWATTMEDVMRAVVGDLGRRQALAGELAPHALDDRSGAAEAVRGALDRIAGLIAEPGAAVTERVLTARAERFAPLPAPALAEGAYHRHPEGVIHRERTGDGVILHTADSTVRLTTLQYDLFTGDDTSEMEPELRKTLISARLLCDAPCGPPLTGSPFL